MASRQFLTQKELQRNMDETSDDEFIDRVVFNENTQVIYIAPEKVDCISDEEFLDDDDLVANYTPSLEIAGELEVQYESVNQDFSVPDSSFNVRKDEGYSTLESFGGKTPLELFFQYFDDEVLDLVISNTNLYASQHNCLLSVNKEQICRFLGILILGYHTLPQMVLYWSSKADLGVPIVRQSMARNKFLSIKQNFHLVDNTKIDSTDRFAKVRPLLDLLNIKYKQFGIFTTNLSIHEQMVPYFGKHNCKMFIRSKPIRFGFKF